MDMHNPTMSLACIIVACFLMGIYLTYVEMPNSIRIVSYTTMFIASVTVGLIIGRFA